MAKRIYLFAAWLILAQPLTAAAQAAKESGGQQSAPLAFQASKQICKRIPRTGTLSGFERTCMTASEWAKQSDEQKQVFEDIQGRKGASVCSSGGGGSAGPDSAIAGAPAPGC